MNLSTRVALCAAAFVLAPAALSAQQGHGNHGQHAAPAPQPAAAQQTCGDMEIIGHGPLHVSIEHAEEFALSAAQRAGLDSIAAKLRTDLRAQRESQHAAHTRSGQQMSAAQMQAAHRQMEAAAMPLRRAADQAALARLTAAQRERITGSGHGGDHHAVGSAHPACVAAPMNHGAHGQH